MPTSQQEMKRNLKRRFSKEEIKKILEKDQKVKNPRHTIEGARLTRADKDTRRKILKKLLAPNIKIDDEITNKIKQMLEKTSAKKDPNKDLDKDPTIKTPEADTPEVNDVAEIKQMKNMSFGPDDYKTTNKQPGKKNKQYGDMLKKDLSKANKGNFSVGYNGNKLKQASYKMYRLLKQAKERR